MGIGISPGNVDWGNHALTPRGQNVRPGIEAVTRSRVSHPHGLATGGAVDAGRMEIEGGGKGYPRPLPPHSRWWEGPPSKLFPDQAGRIWVVATFALQGERRFFGECDDSPYVLSVWPGSFSSCFGPPPFSDQAKPRKVAPRPFVFVQAFADPRAARGPRPRRCCADAGFAKAPRLPTITLANRRYKNS